MEMEYEPNEMNVTGGGPAAPQEPDAAAERPAPAPDRRRARAVFSMQGLGATLILAVSSLVTAGIVLLLDHVMPGWRSWPYSVWVLSFAPLYLAAFPLGLLVARRAPAAPPEKDSMTAGRFVCIVLICICVMQAGNIVGLVLQELVRRVLGGEPVNPIASLAADNSLVMRILFMVILAPLVEEFFFRRTLIDRMRPYGEKLAVVTSAAMFGLFHGNLAQMFYAFSLGLVFGWVYLRTGRLRYTVALHAFINLTFGVLSVELVKWAGPGLELLDQINDPSALSDAMWHAGTVTPGLIVYFLFVLLLFGAMIAGLVLLIVRGRRVRFRPAPLELPRGQRFSTAWINVGMILFTVICAASIVMNIK